MNGRIIVKNNKNMPIGECKTEGDITLGITYRKGMVAKYDKKTNITFDLKAHEIYCYGDATSELVRRYWED